MMEQTLDIGEPGPRGYPTLILGPADLPLFVCIATDQPPEHERTMLYLTFSGLFAPGTTYSLIGSNPSDCEYPAE